MLISSHAAIHNAIRALADAVAHQLEITPECVVELTEALMCDLAEVCDDVASGLTPDMVCDAGPSDCDDDTNAHGFYGTYTTDAGGL